MYSFRNGWAVRSCLPMLRMRWNTSAPTLAHSPLSLVLSLSTPSSCTGLSVYTICTRTPYCLCACSVMVFSTSDTWLSDLSPNTLVKITCPVVVTICKLAYFPSNVRV